MKTNIRFILRAMSAVEGSAVVEGGEALASARAPRSETARIPVPSRPASRFGERSRTGLSIGIAVGLHAILGLVHVTRARMPELRRLVQEADYVAVEPVDAPVPPPLESPPPPRPVPRNEAVQEPPPAPEPAANPATGEVVPDEVVPTPQVEVATSTEGGLSVNATVGDGNGMGSGSGTRHDGPAVEGTPVAAAAPAVDPRPARRAYVQRIRGVIGAPRYTNAMRRQGIEGTVLVGVTIDPQGRVVATRVKRSSGNAELDQMVLEYVRANVASLPEPPAEAAWQTNEVGLPYAFDLSDD